MKSKRRITVKDILILAGITAMFLTVWILTGLFVWVARYVVMAD